MTLFEEGFFTSAKLAASPHQAVHKADALRLFLIHKFGGFYMDLDYVVLNDLSHYNNNILVGMWVFCVATLHIWMYLCSGQTLLIWPTACSPSWPRTLCWGEHWPFSRRYTTLTAGRASGPGFLPLLPGNHTSHFINYNLNKEKWQWFDW